MPSARRRASKTDVKKNRASSNPSRANQQFSSPRLVKSGIDYTRLTHEEIRRLGQIRLAKWKDPAQLPFSLLNRIELQQQQLRAQARSHSEAPPPNVNLGQSTRRAGTPVLAQLSFSLQEKTPTLKKISDAVICAKRQIRKDLVFATGNGGSSRTYSDRKPPSKVKC